MRDNTSFAAYCAIMVSGLAGLLHLSPWAILLSSCGLALISILRKHELAFARIGTSATAQAAVMATSVVNAGVIAVAGYGMGLATSWVWG